MNIHAETVIQELVHQGVKTFCVAPGSRNTPLTLAAFNHPLTNTHIHFDERGLGFFALGLAKSSKTKVALIVTSGTAAGNLLPAVMESYHDEIPLVLLTADRSIDLRESGANQSTKQTGIFSHFALANWDIPLYDTSITENFIRKELSYYLHLATNLNKGPCHFNLMVKEPFFPPNSSLHLPQNFSHEHVKNTPDIHAFEKKISSSSLLKKVTSPLKQLLKKKSYSNEKTYSASASQTSFQKESLRENKADATLLPSNKTPSTYYPKTKATLEESHFIELARDLSFFDNGVIFAGKEEFSPALYALAETLCWPIYTDVSSPARYQQSHEAIVHQFNLIDTGKLETKMDAILHFGSIMTEKKCLIPSPDLYMHVSTRRKRTDPASKVTHCLTISPTTFAEGVLPYLKRKKDSPLYREIKQQEKIIEKNLGQYFFHLSEAFIPYALAKIATPSFSYFFGNSLPIRYADLFFYPKEKSIRVFANRGLSGIDGNIATIFGIAKGQKTGVIAVLGDLTFLHDINSLALAKQAEHPIVFIVVNNNGGGIFHHLPLAKEPSVSSQCFESCFGTPQHVSLQHAANLFHLHYFLPKSTEEFSLAIKTATSSSSVSIIEVLVDREESAKLHQEMIHSLITEKEFV